MILHNWIVYPIRLCLALGVLAVASPHIQAADTGMEEVASTNLFGHNSGEPVSRQSGTRPEESLKMTAKELRQARAIFRSQQRLLRREQQLWNGYEPLRPQASSIPIMTSRYRRPTIYIPVYVR